MQDDVSRRRLVATLRARLRQQAQRGALTSVLTKRIAKLEREHDELVEHYAQRHAPTVRAKRPWWKFWSRRSG
jgi:hypothetical protein